MKSKGNGLEQDSVEVAELRSGTSTEPGALEILERAKRRKFSPAYKLRILEEADRCREPGEVSALLRREGLYSSNLTEWRRARQEGALGALSKSRGPKGRRRDPVDRENAHLRKENARLRRRLEQAQMILEIQKKASEILGIPLNRPEIGDEE